jgi:branched-subunit amino acid transport protein
VLAQLAATLGLAAGTWLIRAGFIVSPRGRALAVQLDPWLTYARPAVLAGLLASLSMRGTAVDDLGLLAYATAIALAATVGSVTRSLTYALVAGALALVLLA